MIILCELPNFSTWKENRKITSVEFYRYKEDSIHCFDNRNQYYLLVSYDNKLYLVSIIKQTSCYRYAGIKKLNYDYADLQSLFANSKMDYDQHL